MKNKIFPLIISTAGMLLGLVSCGEEPEPTPTPKPRYSYAAEKFETSKKVMNLGVGESGSFITRISPVIAYDAGLVYESENPSIASVDEHGVITGKSVGNTVVKVSYDKNEKVFAEVKICVIQTVSKNSETLDEAINAQKTKQETMAGLDTIYYREYRDYAKYENGVMTYNEVETTDCYQSKSDAFFGIFTHEEEMKTAHGNYEPSDYAWIIKTDESFRSHMYHINSLTKTTIDVPTQSYMEEGQRVDAVIKLLSSLFRDGKKLWNQGYEDMLASKDLGEDFTNFRHLVTEGYVGDDLAGYSLVQKGYKEEMDAEDEQEFGIPAGTKVSEDIEFTCIWKDGKVSSNDIIQTFTYELDGVEHVHQWKMYFSYELENIELPYPVDSEYRTVENLYDI